MRLCLELSLCLCPNIQYGFNVNVEIFKYNIAMILVSPAGDKATCTTYRVKLNEILYTHSILL